MRCLNWNGLECRLYCTVLYCVVLCTRRGRKRERASALHPRPAYGALRTQYTRKSSRGMCRRKAPVARSDAQMQAEPKKKTLKSSLTNQISGSPTEQPTTVYTVTTWKAPLSIYFENSASTAGQFSTYPTLCELASMIVSRLVLDRSNVSITLKLRMRVTSN